VVQLRLYRRQREDAAAVEVMRSMLSEHFPTSYRLLNHVPDGATVAEIRAMEPKYEEAVFAIATVFETLGFMVHQRVIPLRVVRELAGGVAVALWRKVGPYAAELAEAEDQSRLAEWYEWLVLQLEDPRGGRLAERAATRFPNWRP
jgi:hypothetical protein